MSIQLQGSWRVGFENNKNWFKDPTSQKAISKGWIGVHDIFFWIFFLNKTCKSHVRDTTNFRGKKKKKPLQNDVTNLILTFIYYVVKVHQLHLLSF